MVAIQMGKIMKLECPKCGSENTQKLSLAVEAGTFSSNSFSFGIGGAGTSMGVLGASTSGASTSKMAQKFAAPEKMPVIGGFLAIMLLAAIAAFFFGGIAITVGFWIGVVAAILALAYNLTSFPREFAEWNAKFLCLRCAEVFTPRVTTENSAGEAALGARP